MKRLDESAELSQLLAVGLREVGRGVRRRLTEAGYDGLLGRHDWVLAVLAKRTATSAELAERLGASKQEVSRIVEALHDRGYIVRLHDPADRRRVPLRLTKRGERAVEVARDARRDLYQRLQLHIGATSFNALRRSLAVLASGEVTERDRT